MRSICGLQVSFISRVVAESWFDDWPVCWIFSVAFGVPTRSLGGQGEVSTSEQQTWHGGMARHGRKLGVGSLALC